MELDKWNFVKDYNRSVSVVFWEIHVNGDHYCDLGVPEDESYISLVDACKCMVESDPDYANQLVLNTYLNIADEVISFHMGPYRPRVEP